jgi:hypothetical protein
MTLKPSQIAVALAVLQVATAVSAFAGGLSLAIAPDGDIMGMSTDILEGSPFNDFLVPGLVLLFGVGGSMLLGGIAVWRSWRWGYAMAFAAGAVMVGWITVQVFIINEVNILHYVYWTAGTVTMLLALALWRHDRARAAEHSPRPGRGRMARAARQ